MIGIGSKLDDSRFKRRILVRCNTFRVVGIPEFRDQTQMCYSMFWFRTRQKSESITALEAREMTRS